jgi:hypothetical protein
MLIFIIISCYYRYYIYLRVATPFTGLAIYVVLWYTNKLKLKLKLKYQCFQNFSTKTTAKLIFLLKLCFIIFMLCFIIKKKNCKFQAVSQAVKKSCSGNDALFGSTRGSTEKFRYNFTENSSQAIDAWKFEHPKWYLFVHTFFMLGCVPFALLTW